MVGMTEDEVTKGEVNLGGDGLRLRWESSVGEDYIWVVEGWHEDVVKSLGEGVLRQLLVHAENVPLSAGNITAWGDVVPTSERGKGWVVVGCASGGERTRKTFEEFARLMGQGL